MNRGGPSVVAMGGGHGLAASLRAIRTYAGSLTAVVSVADDGGSTGRLRRAGATVTPGDIRRCLVALADPNSLLARALDHRFDEIDGELSGHAAGNLLLAALAETAGGLVPALDELGRLLGCDGRVLPASIDSVSLSAETESGEVQGQVNVAMSSGIDRVRWEPPDHPVPQEVIDAILAADQIVLGPGSLFTSVLASALAERTIEALSATQATLILVVNLRPQMNETANMTVADHFDALARHGIRPHLGLIDHRFVDPAGLNMVQLDEAAAGSLDNKTRSGPLLISAPLAEPDAATHDAERLAAALSLCWQMCATEQKVDIR